MCYREGILMFVDYIPSTIEWTEGPIGCLTSSTF